MNDPKLCMHMWFRAPEDEGKPDPTNCPKCGVKLEAVVPLLASITGHRLIGAITSKEPE